MRWWIITSVLAFAGGVWTGVSYERLYWHAPMPAPNRRVERSAGETFGAWWLIRQKSGWQMAGPFGAREECQWEADQLNKPLEDRVYGCQLVQD
ncbi:MAG TPA: hypothetical protein VJP78_04945 [Thermoleophilia bacterium]|nr:hypothetical protein [Thermoleophilia bacterium]